MIFNKKQIYLDNGATTKVDPTVVKAMMPYFNEKYGNPSSQHTIGQQAKIVLEESRAIIAKSINAKPKEIIFTAGGTQSNNLALKGVFFAVKQNSKRFKGKTKPHIITTKIEHDCVLNTSRWLEKQGAEITYLNVDNNGFIDIKQLKKSITKNTILVSIIHGNNEIGTIQNLEEIGQICKEKNILFHSDACQSYTKVPINVRKMNLNLLTLNSHKIHGPKGVGALYVKEGIKITPLSHGGGHEKNIRSGTENIPGIVGFAKAVSVAKPRYVAYMAKLRDKLINEILKIPNTKLNGATDKKRLCNNINISFMNIEGEALGGYLDAKGICTSTGSACSSHSLEPSHVLLAVGLSPLEANTSIRLTLSKFNTEKEIDYTIKQIKNVVNKLRRISPFS